MALVADSNSVGGSVLPHIHISMVNIQTNWQIRIYSCASVGDHRSHSEQCRIATMLVACDPPQNRQIHAKHR